ncbi:uncharacterized protein K452DRAFT_347938 [Aplosporella prunicola CBS 121167]|uniref:Acetyl-CoA synthetase-like protein n=1 Tax=Aplosporella prunicola CBS 121167 TaxID=1176127 RepID=A0A6A6BSY6_9PEZI|nr:uncharacterized protein K452DRAFT_347938 [Aplosporella prunicola CBS 121167]KAF2147100.1 hypothetical protein K452DRAFT_347938 [Aplosporella prunicola CBS 121167]
MPIFKSLHPDVTIPTDLTTWDWLFDSSYSPLSHSSGPGLAGYQDAFTGQRINWAQVKTATTYVSTALVKKYSLKPGQTVSLFSRNTIQYPIAMHGALRAGAMVSGASPAYNVEEMAYALKIAKAKFLMTSPGSMEVATLAAEKAGLPKDHLFLLEGKMEGYTTVEELVEIGKSYGEQGQIASFKIPKGLTNKDLCGFLSFSSGTTGLPKAVMISHHNVIAQAHQVQPLTSPDKKKVLAVLPFFHITGLIHILHVPVLFNAEVYMVPSFTMASMLQAVQDHQIDDMLVVPPIIIRLVRDPIVNNYDLSCVKRFSSGAAPMSPEIIQLLEKKFPGTSLTQGYGMTESSSCITAHPSEEEGYQHAHKVGTIVPGTEVKIIKEDGTEGDVGEPGEILARGPQVVMGYLDNEKATRETFDKDGWLHTGDQGVIDKDGYITILDRIKEMIKVKGIGVAPTELEDLLLGHEKVEDCAVMGLLDDYAGELPKAFVVLKPGLTAGESIGRELLAYVKEKKVRYKHVKEIEFVSEIPKSASGKILRRVLRNRKSGTEDSIVVRDTPKERAML